MMMRKTILYIAMSLDGYIADSAGGVQWLAGHGETDDVDDSYLEFTKNIDTIIMGRKTYQQVSQELSPDVWVYQGTKCYVATSKHMSPNQHVEFINDDICKFVDQLKQQAGKDIWLVGGANLAAHFIQRNQIDEYYIAVIPVILGGGIALFPNSNEVKLHLDHYRVFNGIAMLRYTKRNELTNVQ